MQGRLMSVVVLALVWVSSFRPVLAQARAEARHHPLRIGNAPTIDGKLEEECWQRAKAAVPARDKPVRDAKDLTEVRICYDGQALYFGADLYRADMDKLSWRCKGRDDEVCIDDSLEIFLYPNPTAHQVYHWIFNALPAYYDGREHFTDTGTSFSSAWNGHIRAATSKHADRWSLEVAIPFASLELAPGTTPEWGLGLLANRLVWRNRYQWWPPESKFISNGPAYLGRLPLKDVDFADYYCSIRDLGLSTYLTQSGEASLMLAGQAHTHAKVPKAAEVTVEATAPSGKALRGSAPLPLKPSSACPFRLFLPAGERGRYKVVCRLIDVEAKRALAIKEAAIDVSAQPLSVALLRPAYRSSLFSKMKDKTVRAEVTIHAATALLGQLALAVDLRRAGDEKRYFERRYEDLTEPRVVIEKDLAACPDGRYALQCVLSDKRAGGKPEGQVTATINKHPPNDTEVWFEKRTLFVNGKPTFIRALTGVNPAEYFARISVEGGINVCANRGGGFSSDGAFLPILAKHGAWVMPWLVPWYQKASGTKLPAAITDAEKKSIENWRRDYFSHPRLLSYNVGDEPDIHPQISIPSLRRGKALMEELDPYRPLTLTLCAAGNWASERYQGIVDIRKGSDYLYPAYGALCHKQLQTALEDIRMAIWEGGDWHPYVSLLQHFDSRCWEGRGIPNFPNRHPCFLEYRYMAYRIVQLGGVGVEWWAHSHDYTHPQMNPAAEEAARAIAGELAFLEPVICGGRQGEGCEVTTEAKDVSLWARAHDGDLFIIAANNAPEAQRATIRINAPDRLRKLTVLSEGRSVPLRKNAFEDHFSLLGVHIYTTRMELPELPIDRAFQEEVFTSVPTRAPRKGDFAREALGARATGRPTKYINFPDLAAFAIDDDVRTCWFDGSFRGGWQPTHDVTDPKKRPFLTIDFSEPQAVSRVAVRGWQPLCYPKDRTYYPKDYDVQVPEAKAWRTVAEVRNNAKPVSGVQFRSVRTKQLRFVFHQGSIRVAEAEAYK